MRHEIVNLPEGWAGTDATVEAIRNLVEDALQDPVVVSTAHDIVRHLPERDRNAEFRAVSAFVRGKIRYTSEAIETIKTPRVLLDEIRRHGKAVGDCDDHVVLWAALLRVLGHTVRFRVVSQRPDGLANHIYGEAFEAGRWVSDDLIVKNKPVGWRVPPREITREKGYGFGLGGLEMAYASSRNGVFVPGGTRKARRIGRPPARMLSNNVTASEYAFKQGANLVLEEEGELGFLPGILSVASGAVSRVAKKYFGKKEAAAPYIPAPAPAPVRKDNTLLYIGGAVAALLILPKILKR